MSAESLRNRRIELELTIEQVANLIGVTPAALSRWERGKRTPHRVLTLKWEAVMANIMTGRLRI